MKILIACEYSGIVRDCFDALGHEAFSCDLDPTDSPSNRHHQGDVLEYVKWVGAENFDLMIAHPPCTYLCSSGLHWNNKVEGREQQTIEALAFVKALWDLNIEKVCIENPVGCINTRLPFMPKPQYIQPYDFGEDASKKTGLWTRGLPKLVPTEHIPGREVIRNGKTYRRWSNQTDSGQNALGPSASRGKDRSKTYFGIAEAMALQWG